MFGASFCWRSAANRVANFIAASAGKNLLDLQDGPADRQDTVQDTFVLIQGFRYFGLRGFLDMSRATPVPDP